jgi:hypothetical protein
MSAPIGLFAYNRPEHLARALKALARCPELASSQLVVFCDGPKPTADAAGRERIAQTRKVARELAPPNARVIEREENLGLARSIRTGVSSLCDEFGGAIILEDDLEVSATFLRFMNEALDRYADEPRVMQVSGYMYPVDLRGADDAMFVPSISCWGWGVWARSWAKLGTGSACYAKLERDPMMRRRFDLEDSYPYFEMLQAQHRGEVDSWGIAWNLDVFAADGLVLYPRTSLVANRGHDGSGAHREESNPFEADAHDFIATRWPAVGVDTAQYRQLCEFIRRASRGSLTARVGRLWRKAKVMLQG